MICGQGARIAAVGLCVLARILDICSKMKGEGPVAAPLVAQNIG